MTFHGTHFLLLFLAGGLGTLSRYGLNRIAQGVNLPIPWGTTMINVLGCLCFGVIAELFQQREYWSFEARVIMLTGFFGAFTTFSTYMFEIQLLLRDGAIMTALSGFVFQNTIGFMAILLGSALSRNLTG